jgi:hypothetical protein
MKKFFKALALVLALTLVLGTIPASAAVDADKVRKEKTLYVDGTKGFKTVDGEQQFSLLKARTTYWKLLKIKKAEAKQLGVTAESSAPEIVKTNDETMGVHAYAIGEATIKLAADGKVYTVAVTAKKSAEVVTFGRDFEDTEKPFYAGKTYEISLPRTVNKVKLDTDERRLFVKNEKGEDASAEEVVVTADATAPRLWTVKFLKAGKYTVIGEAFQSKKYDGTTASFEATIEVKTPELADNGIKQTAVNAFQLTFDGDANAVDDFKPQEIYYKVADSVVPFSLLKEVKVDADDNTKVNVTMHGNFVGGIEYFVKVGEKTVSFVACGTSAKDIASFVITSATVEYGDFRNIGFKYLNAEGIDITATNTTLLPTFELVSNNQEEVVVAGTQIYFYEKGKTATVKGSVTTDYGNEANGYKPTVIETTGSISSVDQAKAQFQAIIYSFEGDGTKAFAAKDSKNVHDYAIGDNLVLNIWFKYRNAANTADEYKSLYEEGVTRVAVSDENFAVVTAQDTVKSYVDITGIKAIESIPVILYKTNTEGNEYAFQTVSIKIMDARKLTKAVLTASKANLNLEKDGTWYDKITLTLETTDQYGAGIAPGKTVMSQTDVTIANVGTLKIDNSKWSEAKAGVAGKYTYEVTGGAFTWAEKITNDTTGAAAIQGGSIVLSVKVNDSVNSNNAGIAIADKTAVKTVAFIPTLTAASLDTSVTPDTTLSSSTFYVKKSKAGFDAGETFGWFLSKDEFTAKDYTGYDVEDFVYTVSYNGGLINSADNFYGLADTLVAVTNSKDASDSAIKAKAGTYVFTLYRVAEDSQKKLYLTNFGSKTCVVSDAQIMPVVTVKTDVSDFIGTPGNLAVNVDLANSVLNVKWNGNDYASNVVKADVVKSRDNSDYIKSVTVKVPNDTVGNVFIEVPVNKLINGTNK